MREFDQSRSGDGRVENVLSGSIAGGWWRAAGLCVVALAASALLWWRGPNWSNVLDAFGGVAWGWIAAAAAFNVVSVLVRTLCWQEVIAGAIRRPYPRFPLVLSGYSIGMLANLIFPGRVGEAARVSVLVRKLPYRRGLWLALLGTVAAQRLLDVLPIVALVVVVVVWATLPAWAATMLAVVVCAGVSLLALGVLVASRHEHDTELCDVRRFGRVREIVVTVRQGLGVLRRPCAALIASAYEAAGWICQLLAVWATMHAFHLSQLPLITAALVLVLMNIANLVPLWPGNVGLTQAAIALPLVGYGIPYAHGFAFGIGLQALEALVAISFGTAFATREGLTLRSLPRQPA